MTGTFLKIAVFLTAFGVLYWDTLVHIAGTWFRPEGSHGPLIVAVSLYLIWRKRKDFRELPKSPALLPGALLTGLGCFMLFSGKLSSTMLLQQISIVPTLLGAIGVFWGWAYVNALLIPVGYLIFLTGFAEEILGSGAIYLQTLSARIAAQLLALTGISVFLDGTVIELPHISLEVVRACSGINHIVALLALAVPLASMTQRTAVRKYILFLAALFIGIFANGVRIALIGLYTLYFQGGPLHGPYDTLYVSFIFFFGMVVLVVLSHFLKRTTVKPQIGRLGTISTSLGSSADNLDDRGKRTGNHVARKRLASVILLGLIFIVTLGFGHLYKPVPVKLKTSLQTFPNIIGNFTGKPLDRISERLKPFAADEELLRVYEDGAGKRVELYIGYFEVHQSGERKIIDYRRDWMHEEAQRVPIGHASGPVMINKTRLRDRNHPADVYFWYFMDGRLITSRYIGKLATFWGALTKRKTNAGVIVIQTRNTEEQVMPFLRELVPIVHARLRDS